MWIFQKQTKAFDAYKTEIKCLWNKTGDVYSGVICLFMVELMQIFFYLVVMVRSLYIHIQYILEQHEVRSCSNQPHWLMKSEKVFCCHLLERMWHDSSSTPCHDVTYSWTFHSSLNICSYFHAKLAAVINDIKRLKTWSCPSITQPKQIFWLFPPGWVRATLMEINSFTGKLLKWQKAGWK